MESLIAVPVPAPYTTVVIEGVPHILMDPSVLRRSLPSTEPSEAMVEFLVDIERRLMNAQPTIGAADNASFIDNHLEPIFALLKEAVGERSCQHSSAPSGLAALNESQGK